MKSIFIALVFTVLLSTVSSAIPKCYDAAGGDKWCMDRTVSQPYANIIDAVLAAKAELAQSQYSECKSGLEAEIHIVKDKSGSYRWGYKTFYASLLKAKGATPSISGNSIGDYEIVADIHNHPVEDWDTNGFSGTDINGKTRDKYLVDCKTDSLLHYDHATGLVEKYVAGKWYPHANICKTPKPGEDIYITPDCTVDTTALESLLKQRIALLQNLLKQRTPVADAQVEQHNWILSLTKKEFSNIKQTINDLKIDETAKNEKRKLMNEWIKPYKENITNLLEQLAARKIVPGFNKENTQAFESF